MKSLTILEVLKRSEEYLQARGADTPRLDSEILLAYGLGTTRLGLYTHFDQPLSEEEMSRCRALVVERGKRMPVAYITGVKEFMGESFDVTPAVLIPRPDTEILVEVAQEILPASRTDQWILDLGTGSGCILLSLLKRCQKRGVGLDVSWDALQVAQRNAKKIPGGDRASLVVSDLLAGVRALQRFDLIVANLPYVASRDLSQLAPEIHAEPGLALDGGAEGLDVICRLLTSLPGRAAPGTWLFLEVGMGQAETVSGCAAEMGVKEIRIVKDLAGIDRVVAGRLGFNRPPSSS